MKFFLAAMVISVLAAITSARPSGVEVVHHPHDPHHEPSFLGSLSHVLKVTSHLLHGTANLGSGLGAILHTSNLAHGHEHHPVAHQHSHASAVYVPNHNHIPVYPSAHAPVQQVSTYSSLHNEV